MGGAIRILLAIAVLLLAFRAEAAGAAGGRLDLGAWAFDSQGPVSLAGEWQFVRGRFVGPADPWPADSTLIKVPGAWTGIRSFGYGAGTYRLTVDCSWPRTLAVNTPYQHTAMALSVNGRELARQGTPGTTKSTHVPGVAGQTVLLQGLHCPLDIRVQVSNFEIYRAGMVRALTLGPPARLLTQRESEVTLTTIGASAAAAIGVFGLFSVLARRRDWSSIVLGLYALTLASYVAFSPDGALQSWLAGVGFEGRQRIWFGNSYLLWAMHPVLAQALFPRHSWRPAAAALAAFCAAGFLLALLAPLDVFLRSGPLSWLGWMTTSAYLAVVLLRAVRHGDRSARILLVGLCALVGAVIHDLASPSASYLGRLVPIGNSIYLVTLAMLLGQRYARALATEELRAAEQKHRADLLVTATKAGVLDWETSTGVVRASARYREMLGLDAGRDAAELPALPTLVHPDDREAVRRVLETHENDRAGPGLRRWEPLEFRMRAATGETVWVHLEAVTVAAEDGRPLRHICTFIDISELKSAEERLQEAQVRLASEAQRAGLAQVTTNVLHNVGNVLTSVNVSAHVLSGRLESGRSGRLRDVADLLEAEMARIEAGTRGEKMQLLPGYVRDLANALEAERSEMLGEVHRLFSSVDHIKNVVAMQQSYAGGGGGGSREQVSMATLVGDTLTLQQDVLARNRVTVQRDFARVSPAPLDRTRIMQVLVNLVGNACDAMAANGGERILRVAVRQGSSDVSVSVSDNGSGISPEHRAKLFAHGFTTRAEGHGFGLHSCAQAAREMGGELTVESDGPGKGATFTLRLPR
ncbi:ATP-binding protein [Ramlibacter albus]|uniref:histidine kinase n=1 Tax=Ramlibacter albus TaxID=2079448 RepID=A0A923S4S7_9BURK|nr:ATP-binding protein [Ramlibacter albus]MBC5764437.1 PAS domain-containing protein [Ramlibacter albus]